MAGWLLPNPEQRLEELATTRPSNIRQLLSAYPKPERIRAQQRAQMLRTTARELQALHDKGQLDALIAASRLGGAGGFYDVMKAVSAFAQDELEKKIRVLAHDLHRERIIEFKDPNHLRPAVEYHILRLYIRTGRVYPTDESIREHLSRPGAWSRGRLIKLLRQAVEEAMNLTGFYAGLDVATLNYLEWQIGRAVCTPENPNCDHPSRDEMPPEVAELSPFRCAYASFCRAFNDPHYGWYHEPQIQKAIY